VPKNLGYPFMVILRGLNWHDKRIYKQGHTHNCSDFNLNISGGDAML
jgi:hypothetical protein